MSLSEFVALPIFTGVDLWLLALLFAVYFGAFFVKGAVGVGSLTPTVVFGTLILGPHHAIALAAIVNILSQAQYVRPALRDGSWTIVKRIIVPNFLFAAIGVWIFGRLGSAELTFALGLALGGLVVADLLGLWNRLAQKVDVANPIAVFVLSGMSGLISGVTGAGGLLFIAVYLRIICTDKVQFRGTILLLSMLVVGWRAAVMSISGHVDLTTLLESFVLLPTVVVGGIVGTMLYARISERHFTRMLHAVMLFGATVLLWRGARQLLGL